MCRAFVISIGDGINSHSAHAAHPAAGHCRRGPPGWAFGEGPSVIEARLMPEEVCTKVTTPSPA
jgi:hypothetical protein